MANSSVGRKSFIDSSIKTARLYVFQGLDLSGIWPNTSSDVANMASLFEEWRVALESQAKNSSQPQLILIAIAHYSPVLSSVSFPVELMQRNLNWLNIYAYNYNARSEANFTYPRAALHNPTSQMNTDAGMRAWNAWGLSAKKLVLGLPIFGYAWTLKNPQDNGIGAHWPLFRPLDLRFLLEQLWLTKISNNFIFRDMGFLSCIMLHM